MSFCLILLAAGNSNRFKSNLAKPYHKIGGKTLIELSLNKALIFKEIKKIIIVHKKKHLKALKKLNLKNIKLLIGGKTRQESTFKALKFLSQKRGVSKVLIHDAARPNFSSTLLKRIILSTKYNRVVIPVLKIEDAIKQQQKKYVINKNRTGLFLTQTPQCFNFKEIYRLHKYFKDRYLDDDFSLINNFKKIKFIEGEKNNFKITDKNDLNNLKKIYKSQMKLGIGFDVHRLVPGRKLYLGGLKINSKLGTLGHSDGDPVLHALIDSVLGASGQGDIGTLFSDRSKKYKNIRSTILLKKVLNKIKLMGYFLNNIDINIITQKPKIQKIKSKIIKNISKICGISLDQVNVKGKTTEKLGVVGKEKAIACEVITSIIKYD